MRIRALQGDAKHLGGLLLQVVDERAVGLVHLRQEAVAGIHQVVAEVVIKMSVGAQEPHGA